MASCGIMVLGIVFYMTKGTLSDGYTMYKSACIFLICILKVVDTIEDVYHGRLQQLGRLDIGAKILCTRLLSYMILFCVLYIALQDLLVVLVITTTYYVLVALYLNWIAREELRLDTKLDGNSRDWKKLMLEVLPLAATASLMMYLGNGPKYIIDGQVSDLAQTAYNIVFMPVFVISLLSSFIYNPLLVGLSHKWQNREYKKFFKIVNRQIFIIVGITIFAIVFGEIIGLTILGIIYDVDLSQYSLLLILLLLSGGMLAFINLLSLVLTIWRKQKSLMVLFFLCAVIFVIIGEISFGQYELIGVTSAYLISLTVLAGLLYSILCRGVLSKKKESDI